MTLVLQNENTLAYVIDLDSEVPILFTNLDGEESHETLSRSVAYVFFNLVDDAQSIDPERFEHNLSAATLSP